MNRFHLITQSTDKEWLKSILKSDIPKEVGMAARRLYELGEQDLALKTLLDQLRQFKNSALHKVKRDVACFEAMLQLGFIRDERAAPDLIDALDIYTLHAASALGKINDEKLRRTLRELARSEGRRGFGAILALGCMKDKDILPTIIAIVKDMKSYEKKYLGELSFDSTYIHQFMFILGEYDAPEAKRLFNELRDSVMSWGHAIMTSTDKEWLKSLLKTETPINVRAAAKRLYELGEKDLGLKIILDQMNQYKDSNTHRSTKIETCPAAAVELGSLRDERAIPDLIEALDIYTIDAALALSMINGDTLRKELRKLSKTEGIRGFGAILALGIMLDKDILPSIMDIAKNREYYEEKYANRIPDSKISWTYRDVLHILGNYDEPEAEKLFLEKITKFDIRWFITNYTMVEDAKIYPREIYGLSGWRITKKLGWDKYITPDKFIILLDGHRPRWEKEENVLVDLIWDDVKRKIEEA